MANTKTTTPIKLNILGWAALGGMLSCFAASNLFGTSTPAGRLNEFIIAEMARSDQLAFRPRLELLATLRPLQEEALKHKPSDPLAWDRLATLRLITQGDMQDAFVALRMSDLLSPGEPEQLPRRAWMWQKLRSVETPDQQAYQDVLWRKAFWANRDATWKLANEMHIVNDVAASLKRTDDSLYGEWEARINDAANPAPAAQP
jgi:hypothetical protein